MLFKRGNGRFIEGRAQQVLVAGDAEGDAPDGGMTAPGGLHLAQLPPDAPQALDKTGMSGISVDPFHGTPPQFVRSLAARRCTPPFVLPALAPSNETLANKKSPGDNLRGLEHSAEECDPYLGGPVRTMMNAMAAQ
jgi:hypothetical protein